MGGVDLLRNSYIPKKCPHLCESLSRPMMQTSGSSCQHTPPHMDELPDLGLGPVELRLALRELLPLLGEARVLVQSLAVDGTKPERVYGDR